MNRSWVEFDQWVICPRCTSAMVGEVGEECFLCHVEMVATPLYPEFADTEAEKIVASVQRGRKEHAQSKLESNEAICAEFGVEYTPEEQEILDEFF